jgi:hypothetical protein
MSEPGLVHGVLKLDLLNRDLRQTQIAMLILVPGLGRTDVVGGVGHRRDCTDPVPRYTVPSMCLVAQSGHRPRKVPMIPALLVAVLLSVCPAVAGSPKLPARVALQATENGQVRLVGPHFMGYADQILTLDDGGWELVGTEKRPAKFASWKDKPNEQEWVSGLRIIYSPERGQLYVSGSGVMHIPNKGKPDGKK